MKPYLGWLAELAPHKLAYALKNRFVREPITTTDGVADFVQTRAAYVAQTSLFGYLQERMGISYPKYFLDDGFAASIKQAQFRVYRACAADLAVFAAAFVSEAGMQEAGETARLAARCFDHALKNSGADMTDDPAPAIEAFEDRAGRTTWRQAAIMDNAFTESLAELVEAAPVVDEFKHSDSEIVMNSIRFRWRDIREQFRKRADPVAISSDFRRNFASPANRQTPA